MRGKSIRMGESGSWSRKSRSKQEYERILVLLSERSKIMRDHKVISWVQVKKDEEKLIVD